MTNTNKTTTVKRLKELFAYWAGKGKTVSVAVNWKEYTNISTWRDGDLLLTGIESTDAIQKYHVQYIKKTATTSASNTQRASQPTGVTQPPLVSTNNAQWNSATADKPRSETIPTYRLTSIDEDTFLKINSQLPNYQVKATTGYIAFKMPKNHQYILMRDAIHQYAEFRRLHNC